MNENQIEQVSEWVFKKRPLQIEKKTIGLCNEVYELKFSSESFILRMNQQKDILFGTHKHLPLFKKLYIKTPEIVAEDYSKDHFPFCYHILTKIEGRDLGLVIDTLNHSQLRQVASEISNIFDKFNSPVAQDFLNDISEIPVDDKGASWKEIMNQKRTILDRNAASKVVDEETLRIYNELLDSFEDYFRHANSRWYYDDLCYKNVMVHEGQFTGLVDLDFLCQGDYLSAVGTIMSSYQGEAYGKIYLDEIFKQQKLSIFQQNIVRVYAILNLVLWTSEEGVKFNSNSSGIVNWENVERKRQKIAEIYQEIVA
ncbi:MAG: phosphotransferase [Bacteroidia bacterium]|nr:phosphotransferase [Bacteroidia bacterium]